MIKPSVGRVVLFVPNEGMHSFGHCFTKGQQHAAIVTAVHSDRLINVAAFDANGKSYGFTSVTLRQPEDPQPGGMYCEWMPFQVGQAAKTEELEKALAGK